MAQRSRDTIINDYYRSMSCFIMVSWTNSPRFSAMISRTNIPSSTMWKRRFTKYVIKYDAIPHSTEQDTLPIIFLLSRQAIPYWTRGATCSLGVSTPKIKFLDDSSTTCHDGINHLHHSNHCSNHSIDPHTGNSHIDGWKTTTHSPRHKPTQHHKGWKTSTILKIVWLSITNQEWAQIPKV
jgi:hypothetical protein